ncbi:hypothetical protein D3C75_902170 [compost metagenome]
MDIGNGFFQIPVSCPVGRRSGLKPADRGGFQHGSNHTVQDAGGVKPGCGRRDGTIVQQLSHTFLKLRRIYMLVDGMARHQPGQLQIVG